MTLPTTTQKKSFLDGGGEMGQLTRTYPWEQTPLGPPDTWPLSLRITLGIVLHSAFPMFLFWGDELTCFYNDAYRPSLGDNGKHPAVGQPGRAVWPEIWNFMGPLIEQVMATGEAVWYENQLVPIFRNGRLEDVYWTFSYSPAYGDDGQIAGMLVTCTETTQTVMATTQLRQSEQRFRNLVRDASVGIIVLSGPEMRVDVVTDAYARLIGRRSEELLHKPLFSVLPEAEAVFRPIIASVQQTNTPLYLYSQPGTVAGADGQPVTGYLDLVYQPYKELDGSVTGVMVLCQDVTKQKQAEESLTRFKYMAENASDAFILMREDGTFAYLNQLALDSLGYTADEAQHLRVPDVDPIYTDTVFANVFVQAQTGKLPPFETLHRKKDGTIYPVEINMGGLLLDKKPHLFAVARNITDRKEAEDALRTSEQRFQAAVAAVQGILWTNNAVGKMEGEQPAWATLTGQSYDEYQGYGWTRAVHPDDAQPTIAAWEKAVAQRSTFVFEHRLRVSTGQWELFAIRAIPLLNTDGSIREWVGVHTNITRQREAETAQRESEARFQSLVIQAPVAIALFRGPNFVIELANERVLEFWGRSLEQVIDLPLFEAMPEASGQGYEELLTSVLETGIPVVAKELPVDLLRGGVLEKTYIDFVYEPYHEAGEAVGIMVVANEITEQVLARQKIEEAEAALRGAIEMAELGTWTIDLTTGILDYSARLRDWFGIGRDELITAERAYRPVTAADRPRVEAAIARAIAPGSDGFYNIEYAVDPTEAGQERILHIQGQAYFSKNGNPYKVSGTARDVTEQRQVQQELERKVAERTQQLQASVRDLERSNQNLQQFAYVASHDLQEPLRKIQSFSKLLVSQHADQLGEGTELLNRLQASANRMSTLIDDLLTFSRISTRQEATASVSLTTVVANVLLDLDLRIQETGAILNIEPLPTIQGDASQLGQLFQNLLSNALKFTRPNNPPQVQIKVQTLSAAALPATVKPTREAAAYYRIDVTDNGIGFDEKYADRIFQVFQRLHGRGQFAGTGIGLAICEKVAANHGGAIAVASQPDQGATFSVYLPT